MVFELINKQSFKEFKVLNKKYPNTNWLIIFFHCDEFKIIEDKKLVDTFETEFNFYVNWINLTDIYKACNDLTKKLHLNNTHYLNIIKQNIITDLNLKYN